HGRTPPLDGPASMDRFANELFALVDRLSIPRFSVVGHSMGGYVIFAMLRARPERLERIALVCTRAAADTAEARRAREINAARVLAEGTGFLAESMAERVLGASPDPAVASRVREIIRAAPAAGVATALRGMAARPDSTALLSSIRAPTLVVAGREDKIVPVDEARAMAAAIPGARLELMDGVGHMPMLERHDEFGRLLGRFLGVNNLAQPGC
ncbi:MAG TPA: alpha/beta fold hydrolase, partial [Planctomycetota bacterium]|nr:alpha/beta fold hydrolase [Planctomycetota bacterium]